MIREPVVVVGGHVDHGKTSLLDYIRGSSIATKESGKITQHIGATEVPIGVIKDMCKNILTQYGFNLTIPGLLFIDTPGHEAFSSLRERGCNVSDIAVLIIDVMQGCQPQTMEVIDYLKRNKTPFVVALNKFDSIKGYNDKLSLNLLLKEIDQGETLFAQEFMKKFYNVVGQLGEAGFNSDRFDQVKDFTTELAMVPISSKTGKGVPELLLFLAGLSQKYLDKNLSCNVEGSGKATVLEVKEEKGFGKTLDVILYDGIIHKGDSVRVDSANGILLTKIKMILKPKALEDIRATKELFARVNEAFAADGLKVVVDNCEGITAGDILTVISEEDAKKIITTIKNVQRSSDKGIIAKVDTVGSADALKELAKKHDIDLFKVETGPLTNEDILEAQIFKEQNFRYGAIMNFNNKVSHDLVLCAEKKGIQVFSSNVIYKLFEDYNKWMKSEEKTIKERILKNVVYPVKFKIMPNYIFRQSKPFVCGVEVIDGLLKPDIQLIQANKRIGVLKKVQENGKDVKEAVKGKEVAVSIENTSADKLDFDKPIYSFIPLAQRKYIRDYLIDDFKELIDELDEILINVE